jgi:outer membrane receptor protein involved in Fe transport
VEDAWEEPVHNGSGGAAYYLTDDLSLHVNVAAGQIEPRAGTLTTSLERPDQETRYMIDVGVRKELKGIGIGTLTGFYVIQDDALVLSGQTAEVDGRVFELYENRDQEQRGIEIDLRSARIEGLVELFFNTVFMETDEKVDGDMERNEKIPEVILSGGLYAQHGAFDLAFHAKHVSPYENARFVPASLGPQPLGDFVELNVNAGYAFGEDRRHRIFVVGENLTDEEYSTVPGYPDWGIRLYAGAKFSF